MINVTFFGDEKTLGFNVTGHSGYSEVGSDIICASVSSAAYMVANTITEIYDIKPQTLKVSDGEMLLKLKEEDADKCQKLLKGFILHIRELSKEYNEFITVTENKE